MKLNRKGFAITSLLYGVLILFSFFVGSYLLALSSKNKILHNLAFSIEKNYKYPNGFVLDSFDNFNNSVTIEDLSAWGIKNPNLSFVKTSTEDTGMLAQFDEVRGYGWAQRYHISGVRDEFSFVNNKYYVRLWVAFENYNKFGLGLFLTSNSRNFYVDPSFVKIIDYAGNEIKSETSFDSFYDKTHVFLPNGFKGWINFPISAIKNDNGDKIDLDNISELIIDVRPEKPQKNTFYILDNLIITKDFKSNKFNNIYEINYRNDLVGIKYSNWYDFWNSPAANNGAIYDISNGLKGETEKGFGPSPLFHYWGEPALGYYNSSNKDVIKKHIDQLSAANIDFIFVDLTNLSDKNSFSDKKWYEDWIWKYQVEIPTTALLDTMLELSNSGKKIPHVVFWASSYDKFGVDYPNQNNINHYVINRLYDEYISKEKYKDLFVYYNGKPLVIGTNPPVTSFDRDITYRYMWALQKNQDDINNGEWTNRILDNKIYGKDENGKIEEMTINPAFSSYYMSLGKLADSEQIYRDDSGNIRVKGRNHGLTFYEYWYNAFNFHPKILMISSWNEWGSQRLIDNNAPCKDYCFTDQYSSNFSEDIEPMKNGHGDLYYKRMKSYILNYKKYENCPRLVDSGF